MWRDDAGMCHDCNNNCDKLVDEHTKSSYMLTAGENARCVANCQCSNPLQSMHGEEKDCVYTICMEFCHENDYYCLLGCGGVAEGVQSDCAESDQHSCFEDKMNSMTPGRRQYRGRDMEKKEM